MSNSRPHKNPTLVRRYAEQYQHCALCPGKRMAHQTHHIWGGKTRYDLRSNLIRLCHKHHDDCHGPHSKAMKVRCLYWKLRAGELDWDEIDKCSGLRTAGWLETLPLDGLAARMRDRLLEHARERV